RPRHANLVPHVATPRRYVTSPPQAPQKIRPFPEEIIAVEFWTGLPSGLAGLLTTPAELAPTAGGAMTPVDARTILVAAAGAFCGRRPPTGILSDRGHTTSGRRRAPRGGSDSESARIWCAPTLAPCRRGNGHAGPALAGEAGECRERARNPRCRRHAPRCSRCWRSTRRCGNGNAFALPPSLPVL